MFKVVNAPHRVQSIDLASVRDTLLYIESDLVRSPDLHRLAAAVRTALTEIDRLEQTDAQIGKSDFTAARFLPARLKS